MTYELCMQCAAWFNRDQPDTVLFGIFIHLCDFYHAMHVVLAWYCYRKSSVRPSVTLMYAGHIGWTSSKVIANRSSEPQYRQSSPRGTPLKFGWNRGGVAVVSRKPTISLKRGKIGPRLLT